MAIYFLRHGQCQANLDETFAGQADNSPLTPLGRNQAAQAAEDLKGVQLAGIISSPLDRTLDTAKIVAKRVGFDTARIRTDRRILERDMGEVSGKKKSEVPNDSWEDIPGVEKPDAFQARVLDFFRELATHAEGDILVVSHSGVGSMLEAAHQGIPAAQFFTLSPYPNGHIAQLDLSWLHPAKNAL